MIKERVHRYLVREFKKYSNINQQSERRQRRFLRFLRLANPLISYLYPDELITYYDAWGFLSTIEYLVSNEKQCAYLVMSKVACSAIKASFFEQEFEDNYSVHNKVREKQGKRYKRVEPGEEDYFSFTFVRNPFDRLVSCYVSKYQTDITKYKKTKNDFEHYLCGYLSQDEGFETFIEKIAKIPVLLMDKHFIPQSKVIYTSNGDSRVDYIGRFETLEQDFLPIQKEYGLKPLKVFNATNKKDWKEYYNEHTAKLAYKIYKEDIKRFGYEDAYKELMEYVKQRDA